MPYGGIGNPQSLGGGSSTDFSTLSGDVTATALGVVTLANPFKLLSTTVNLTKAIIIGNTAGTLAHASGVTLVAGVANRIIIPVRVVCQYTWAGATYGAGGNVSIYYNGTNIVQVGGSATAGGSLGSGNSNTNAWSLSNVSSDNTSGTATDWVGSSLILKSTAQFTDGVTSTGTAVVTTWYHLGTL